MALSATAELIIPRLSKTDRVISVADASGLGFDLTGSTVIVEATDDAGNTLFRKSSDEAAQIEFTDQSETPGDGTIHFVGDDTVDLIVGGIYWIDAWVYRATGEVEQVISRQRWHIAGIVHVPDTTPPSPEIAVPLFQGQQWRRFIHVWRDGLGDGDSDSIIIPETGMRTPNFHPDLTIIDLNGGPWAALVPVEASFTTAGFDVEASGSMVEGTRISVMLTDAGN